MTERQKYQVIQKYPKFEVRRYEACVVAEVAMNSDYAAATNGAFGSLFHYISKGNQGNRAIAMTAPVIATSLETMNSENWRIAFVMPNGSKLEEMPLPNDEKVSLVKLAPQECVALPFKGRATLKLSEAKEAELRNLAHEAGLDLSTEVRIHRFDPPFKPGFLMYNEIVIPLKHLA